MRKLRWLLGIAMLLGAAILAFQKVYSFGHRELAAYVSELRSKGERVTFPELAATLSRHTNDSFARLTNLMLKLGPAPADLQDLRMARFTETGRAVPLYSLDFPWTGATNGAPNGSWTELSRRIAGAAPLLREANYLLQRPAPNFGPWTNYFARLVAWPEKCQSASWLACAALANLREDHHDGALTQIRALAGLANVHEEEFVIATQIARVAIGQAGCELVWEALQKTGWNEDQLAVMQRCWETQDFLSALEKGMEGERSLPLEALAFWEDASSAGTRQYSGIPRRRVSPGYVATVVENDVLFGVRHLHTEVQFARQLRRGRPFKEVGDSIRKLDDTIEKKSRSITRIFYLISLTGIPNWKPAFSRAVKMETQRRLATTAIALRRHELKYGRLPQDLVTLVPEFLSGIPRDCMDAQQLKYRFNPDGSALLYSVGEDGRDDGGDPTSSKLQSSFAPWEGRDVVWPLPAWRPESRNLQSAAQ